MLNERRVIAEPELELAPLLKSGSAPVSGSSVEAEVFTRPFTAPFTIFTAPFTTFTAR